MKDIVVFRPLDHVKARVKSRPIVTGKFMLKMPCGGDLVVAIFNPYRSLALGRRIESPKDIDGNNGGGGSGPVWVVHLNHKRPPGEAPQMMTPTQRKTLKVVESDVIFLKYEGHVTRSASSQLLNDISALSFDHCEIPDDIIEMMSDFGEKHRNFVGASRNFCGILRHNTKLSDSQFKKISHQFEAIRAEYFGRKTITETHLNDLIASMYASLVVQMKKLHLGKVCLSLAHIRYLIGARRMYVLKKCVQSLATIFNQKMEDDRQMFKLLNEMKFESVETLMKVNDDEKHYSKSEHANDSIDQAQRWRAACQRRLKNRNELIKKLKDNCEKINEMPGESLSFSYWMEQATTTTLEAVAPTPDYTTMAQLAVNIITLMPVFDGNPGDLEGWLTAAAQAGAHLEAIDQSLPNAIRTSIYGVLLRRLSPAVRADCGIEITTDLACVTRKLKEKNGRSGVLPSADQALRLVKQRFQAGTDASAIGYEVRFLEKLIKEAVQMELPDKLRGHVRTLDENASFEAVLAKIEEEDIYQASKEDKNSGWKTVEQRRDRREVQREDRKIPPPPPPPQPQFPQKKANGGQRRERPKCWTCGSTRHLQRACLSLYRRDQRGQAYLPNQNPMEVNAVQHPEGTWIFRPRRQTPSYPSAASSRSSGSDGSSDDEWPSLPSVRGKQPRQPAGKPAVSVAALSSIVPGARDALPVVWSPTWGCTVLIDTGSTSTIIKKKIVRNRGWQSQVKLCICVATTVAGPTSLSGELVLSLKGLSGENRSVVAHVMDWASNEYDAILGTDALRCVKGSVRMRKYDWIVRLGTMRYRSEGGVSRSGHVGAAVVKKMDHIRADNVTQHFEAVFHTEGEPLSATGRVRH
ncbi:hypothetical protein AAG570_000029 [Ranatra chinensis]|uniref:Peptidase A2 domain-containing protein n=1 Tax=Ranatra chinensis TaxID=642074 RepID=A0ABD0Z6D4_9HEMI